MYAADVASVGMMRNASSGPVFGRFVRFEVYDGAAGREFGTEVGSRADGVFCVVDVCGDVVGVALEDVVLFVEVDCVFVAGMYSSDGGLLSCVFDEGVPSEGGLLEDEFVCALPSDGGGVDESPNEKLILGGASCASAAVAPMSVTAEAISTSEANFPTPEVCIG